jgi:hypothetical protein
MATKNNCPTLAKVSSDEPIFVLRAQDKTAPATIRRWVALNIETAPARKLAEALECAEVMERWPNRKMPD